MRKYLDPIKQSTKIHLNLSLKVLLACLLFCVLALPLWSQAVGNLFFGKVPILYNVTLAQVFFKNSAYPFFGKARPYAHYQLSRTYFIQGKLEASILEANKELELYPENKRTHYILGLTHGYMNHEDKAIEEFGKFIVWKPDTWAARNDKAWLEFRVGDLDAALASIEPVAHLEENPWVQNTYGVLLMNKQRYPEAKKALENAQFMADKMVAKDWGTAYPGNDPRIYSTGLSAMRLSVRGNLKLLEQQLK
jgi:tetratricopeptide (TPR) repeat protein